MKGEIDKSAFTNGNFNASVSVVDKNNKQEKNNNPKEEENKQGYCRKKIIKQLDLNYIYREIPPTVEYTFTKIDSVLGHQTNHSKCKGTEIINTFSEHKGNKLEIRNRKIIGNL